LAGVPAKELGILLVEHLRPTEGMCAQAGMECLPCCRRICRKPRHFLHGNEFRLIFKA
jgi:hypothetical protein